MLVIHLQGDVLEALGYTVLKVKEGALAGDRGPSSLTHFP